MNESRTLKLCKDFYSKGVEGRSGVGSFVAQGDDGINADGVASGEKCGEGAHRQHESANQDVVQPQVRRASSWMRGTLPKVRMAAWRASSGLMPAAMFSAIC